MRKPFFINKITDMYITKPQNKGNVIMVNMVAVDIKNYLLHDKVIKELTTGLDVPVGGYTTPEAVLDYFMFKDFAVILLTPSRKKVIGLFALNYLSQHNVYATTTIIFPKYRGTGINTALKHYSTLIANSKNIPIGGVIRDWNVRSFAATTKTFPHSIPIPVTVHEIPDYPGHTNGYLFKYVLEPSCEVETRQTVTIVGYRKLFNTWLKGGNNVHSVDINTATIQKIIQSSVPVLA